MAAPPVAPRASRPIAALQALVRSVGFLVFWRPPARRNSGEYLGGRWDWGWTLFVWTSDSAVGPVWGDLVNDRGLVSLHGEAIMPVETKPAGFQFPKLPFGLSSPAAPAPSDKKQP